MKVLGICGSLRKASFNMAALRACPELMPPGMTLHIASLGDIPMYNQDVFDAGMPEPVKRLRSEIAAADGLLFACPEHNFSLTAALKNAIDWASRPPDKTPLRGKPAAIMGASPGAYGTVRAQLQLRQAFVFTQTPALLAPEVLVAKAHEKFDKEGRLTDEATRGYVRKLLEALRDWTVRLR